VASTIPAKNHVTHALLTNSFLTDLALQASVYSQPAAFRKNVPKPVVVLPEPISKDGPGALSCAA
jgi:hypothetical protein